MYMKKQSVEEVNFLASEKYINFTYEISDEGVTPDENGRKIVEAGTVIKVDNVAVGLLFRSVDVTYGPQPGAVIVEGWVLEERLPKTITTAEKTAMSGIHFKKNVSNATPATPTYIVTTDTKYQSGTTYYSKTGETYKALVAGTDYTVGDNITGTVYVVQN